MCLISKSKREIFQENCDLIIVDTSGRHKQEAALFEEMRQVSEATVFSVDTVCVNFGFQ